eukprot:6209590-Pleurochrysis_carterae.AAC.2
MMRGGNAWRGMLYAMTPRMRGGDASAIWKLWDAFDIASAHMAGYWTQSPPVSCRNSNTLLVTSYVRAGAAALAVLASFAPDAADCVLSVDWDQLQLQPHEVLFYAPGIDGLQLEVSFMDSFPELMPTLRVEPRRGWFLLIEGMDDR